MNINELNDNGQPIWVFIATSISIFVATILIWSLMHQIHKYNSLPKRELVEERPEPVEDAKKVAKTAVSRQVRLHLFLRLMYSGHVKWIWKSGILFSLITSGRIGFIRSCSEHGKNSIPMLPLSTAARKYLEKHIDHPLGDNVHCPCSYIIVHLDLGVGFECSKLETVN